MRGRRQGAPEPSPPPDFSPNSMFSGTVVCCPIHRLHVRLRTVLQTRSPGRFMPPTLPAPVPHGGFLWPCVPGCEAPHPPPLAVAHLAWLPRQCAPQCHSHHLWLGGHPGQIRHRLLGTQIQEFFYAVVPRDSVPVDLFIWGIGNHTAARETPDRRG